MKRKRKKSNLCGEHIKRTRLKQEMQLNHLAEEMGYKTIAPLKLIEEGRRRIPLEKIYFLDEALGIKNHLTFKHLLADISIDFWKDYYAATGYFLRENRKKRTAEHLARRLKEIEQQELEEYKRLEKQMLEGLEESDTPDFID